MDERKGYPTGWIEEQRANLVNLTPPTNSPNSSTMIIPMRCMNCGGRLADKWLYYEKRLKELQGDAYGKRTYFDGTKVPQTKEAEVMKELGLTRYCCRKVLLTHVDLIQKL